MRTIHTSGGFAGTAVLDLADSRAELDGATYKVALVAEGAATPPAVGHASWQTPTVTTATAAAAVLAQLVDDTTDPGHYNVAVDVIDSGRHELAWAMDATDRTRRALLRVT